MKLARAADLGESNSFGLLDAGADRFLDIAQLAAQRPGERSLATAAAKQRHLVLRSWRYGIALVFVAIIFDLPGADDGGQALVRRFGHECTEGVEQFTLVLEGLQLAPLVPDFFGIVDDSVLGDGIRSVEDGGASGWAAGAPGVPVVVGVGVSCGEGHLPRRASAGGRVEMCACVRYLRLCWIE